MTVADDDAVAPLGERILRIAVRKAPEDELEVDRRHRAAGMARRGERRHFEDVGAGRDAERREPRDHRVGELRSLEVSEDHSRTLGRVFMASTRRVSIDASRSSYDFSNRRTPLFW